MTKHAALALLLFALVAGAAQAAPVIGNLVLADAMACKKPDVPAPPPLKNNAERFNVERRYIDLDGSGTCVLMDFWVERQGGSDAAGMRTLEHRFLHLVGRKWVPFETDLELFPFLLHSPSTGQNYLVVAPDPAMDDIAAGGIQPEVYLRGSWKTNNPAEVDTYSLQALAQGKGPVLRALATQLEKRTPSAMQTPAERARIKALKPIP